MPRMTTAQRTAIVTTATSNGLQVFDTDTKSVWYFDATVLPAPGAWIEVTSPNGLEWKTVGTKTFLTKAASINDDISYLKNGTVRRFDKKIGGFTSTAISTFDNHVENEVISTDALPLSSTHPAGFFGGKREYFVINQDHLSNSTPTTKNYSAFEKFAIVENIATTALGTINGQIGGVYVGEYSGNGVATTGVNVTGSVLGQSIRAWSNSSGTVATLRAANLNANNTGAGTVTNLEGVLIDTHNRVGGTATTMIGINGNISNFANATNVYSVKMSNTNNGSLGTGFNRGFDFTGNNSGAAASANSNFGGTITASNSGTLTGGNVGLRVFADGLASTTVSPSNTAVAIETRLSNTASVSNNTIINLVSSGTIPSNLNRSIGLNIGDIMTGLTVTRAISTGIGNVLFGDDIHTSRTYYQGPSEGVASKDVLYSTVNSQPIIASTMQWIGTNGSNRASWAFNGFRNSSSSWTSLGITGSNIGAMIEQGTQGILFRIEDMTASTDLAPKAKMKIDASGNVLLKDFVSEADIATTPKSKLDVIGYVKLGSSDLTGDATPTAGMIRYNSGTDKFQGYTTTGWVDLH